MALLSRLAYERWSVARTIVQNWTDGDFRFECAWHFDDVTLERPFRPSAPKKDGRWKLLGIFL